MVKEKHIGNYTYQKILLAVKGWGKEANTAS